MLVTKKFKRGAAACHVPYALCHSHLVNHNLHLGTLGLLLLLVPQVARLVVEVHLGVVDPLLGAVGEPDGVRVDVPLQLIATGIPAANWGRPGNGKECVADCIQQGGQTGFYSWTSK